MKFLVNCDICEVGTLEPHYLDIIHVCNDCKDSEMADQMAKDYIDAMECIYE